MNSSELAALRGADGYGAGMTGQQTAGYDKVLDWTGSKTLADTFGTNMFALAPLLGGLFGSSKGGSTQVTLPKFELDPRMQSYVYGNAYGDPSSLLGGAQRLWQQNRSGSTPLMQAGLDMQKTALMDPEYGRSLQQLQGVGTGMMGARVATNPYAQRTTAPTVSPGGSGGLLGIGRPNVQSLISAGRGLLG